MSNNIFSEDFDSGDFDEDWKKYTEGTRTSLEKQKQLRSEASAYVGLAIVWFFFITIPLALLFAGLAVVPVAEAIFNIEIGFWTAFFLLLTLRWLIPRPRNNAFTGKDR